jgi:uncharacterized protein YceK
MTRLQALTPAVLLAILGVSFLLSGCATVFDTCSSRGPRVYGGTRLTVACVTNDFGRLERSSRKIGMVLLLELPASMALDTALLPLTIPLHHAQRAGRGGDVWVRGRTAGEDEASGE